LDLYAPILSLPGFFKAVFIINGEFKPALWPLTIPNPPKPDTTIYNDRPLSYTVIRPSELSKDQPIRGRITITLVGWRSGFKVQKLQIQNLHD